ncbi:NUDIX domain-containing protein [Spirillospora sp. CA-294931]|uniref:NUDIX domain-containing protein n=1 Tax=Spirillospora sp. CA-294931 TaxID=3240042 RepID=UPI003D92B807
MAFLQPSEWYASLHTVYISAGMVLTDDRDRVLLVKPNYRPGWSLPGGILDAGESPHECAAREVAEEVGLAVEPGPLLVLDWTPPGGDRPRPIMTFVFDGGQVADPARIRVQDDELDDARFWTWTEAETKMPPISASRIPAARRARGDGRTVYLPQVC